MGNPEQQGLGRLDRVIVRQRIDADVGFLDQILDVLGAGCKAPQIAMQRLPVAEYLVQKPLVSLIGHDRTDPP